MTTTTQLKLGPHDGRRADLRNLGSRHMIESLATDGRFALIEHTIPPRKLAAPIHTHTHEDEYSFVLSGRMGAQIGDAVVEAGPGELVFKPRGIPHAFWNPGDEETHLLELISPGDFAAYFDELSPLLAQPGPPDFEKLAAVRDRYALTMDMSSIERLNADHNLAP
jgi:mannose-6-phosphate isomerase-like protein (cupin superfamily)